MEKDKSPILSASVSMTTMSQSGSSYPVTSAKPFILLIADDFGFKSDVPEKISASEWNEFWVSHSFECCCTVKNNLPVGMRPFFLEYTIKSLQDFSKNSIIENALILNPYKRIIEILVQCESSGILTREAYDQISKLPVADTTKTKILQGLAHTPVRNTPSSNPLQIDSILSLMDLGSTTTTKVPSSPSASDECIAKLSTGSDTTAQLRKLQEYVSDQIGQIAQAIQNAPEFREYATRWYSLKFLLKIAGRNRWLQIYLISSPIDSAGDSLSLMLSQLSNAFNTPDIILWGYPHTTTTSSIHFLEQMVSIADNYKTLLIASLDQNESLTSSIASLQPVRITMEKDEMIPFRRLRTNAASRSGILGVNAPYEPTDDNFFNDADAAWIITAQWIATIRSEDMPFQWLEKMESLPGFAISSAFKLPRQKEITSAGLTPAQNPAIGYFTAPVVILDTGEESPYQSAGFNLMVNRTVRLTAEWISTNSNSDSIEDRANALHSFLVSQLKPYTILSDEASLSIEVEEKNATINVNSQYSVDNYPVRFQFSVEL